MVIWNCSKKIMSLIELSKEKIRGNMLNKIQNADLISFDIFDTLITRKTSTPKGIFKLIEHKLNTLDNFKSYPTILRENFVTIRQESENYSQEQKLALHNMRETTFNCIYQIIQQNYNLSFEQTETLKKLEIEMEQNNLVLIKDNINLLKSLIDNQKRVILISDIYYDENIIRKFLTNLDEIFNNIKIYTSADYGETKRNITLYKIVRRDFPIIKKWYHIGDNKFSDCQCAKWENINAINYIPAQLKPYEKYLLKKYDTYKSEMVIGIARSLRFDNSNRKYQFGCSFAAPILYNYTKWVIDNCLDLGIENIFFVARDGYIPKIIADILIQKKNLKLNTHYFYSSRIASRVITNDNYEIFLNNIFDELSEFQSVDFILKRLNLKRDELERIANFNLKSLTSRGIKYLKEQLYNNSDLRNIVIIKNIDKKELFMQYIKQELGDFSNKEIAFVDINGSGRTQDNLAELIKPFFKHKIHNYYLHNQVNMEQKENSIKHSYLFTSHYISAWIELLCRTIDGQTLGYKKEAGQIVPIKEFEQNQAVLNWGYKDYLQGIKDFTTLMCEMEFINQVDTNSVNIFTNYFEYVSKHLDRETADIIGSIPFSMFSGEKKAKEAAPKMNLPIFLNKKKTFKNISIARCQKLSSEIWKILTYLTKPSTYGYISLKRKLAYLKICGLRLDIRCFWGLK